MTRSHGVRVLAAGCLAAGCLAALACGDVTLPTLPDVGGDASTGDTAADPSADPSPDPSPDPGKPDNPPPDPSSDDGGPPDERSEADVGPQYCVFSFDCGGGRWCDPGMGACGNEGVCRDRPEVCDDSYQPACGCDGITYRNPCAAAAEGVAVQFMGECSVVAPCHDSAECADGLWCDKGVGNCTGAGECRPRPEGCPAVYEPVCGCDHATYDNECHASASGVTIAYGGECEVVVIPCFAHGECGGPERYCAKAPGDCDGGGSCQPRPSICFAPIAQAFCGCDGITYPSECDAAKAGANVAAKGACAEPGCKTSAECAKAQFCAKVQGDCKGIGACKLRPTACEPVQAEVCGCDGITYYNDCKANLAGISVAGDGPCLSTPH